MIKVLGILVITLLIIWKEIPPLIQDKKKKEIWVFFIFQLSATSLLSLIAMNVKIPSPLEVIRIIYQPVSDTIFRFLS